jgi:uncharacterized membrane protein YgaE (UPF0421/DUF939 family)
VQKDTAAKAQQNSQLQATNLLAGLQKLAEMQNDSASKIQQNSQQQSVDMLAGLQQLAEMQILLATQLEQQSKVQTVKLADGFNEINITLKEAMTSKKKPNYGILFLRIIIGLIAIGFVWIKISRIFFA